MAELISQYSWIGIPIWALLYISDYTFTIVCARMYQNGVRNKIAFEGSYELNPYFQRDIDSLRVVSPRFVVALATTSVVLLIIWRVTHASIPEVFVFLLGALTSTQLSLHIRHIRNFFLFRTASTDAVRGRIEYSRPLTLRVSAIEMLSFSGMFLVLFAFTGSWFILGGALSLLGIASKHSKLARKHVSLTPTGQEQIASSVMN